MDKLERKKIAEEHTMEMEKKYKEDIEKSVSSSVIFSPEDNIKTTSDYLETEIVVCNIDTVSAAIENDGCTVLNFASYKNPGGGFIRGAMAQEEALCHESYLYNVLSEQKDFYEWNRHHINNSLYEDRIIWTPDVVFERDKIVRCNIITCAAPNYSAASGNGISKNTALMVMKKRIRKILDVTQMYHTDIFIAGAFGCGVFGNDAADVAKIFKDEILRGTSIKRIIFAVPSGNGNYDKFNKIMGNM